MRGRLTLEKVNSAINDMASYAEANAQLISAPKKKVTCKLWFFFFRPPNYCLQIWAYWFALSCKAGGRSLGKSPGKWTPIAIFKIQEAYIPISKNWHVVCSVSNLLKLQALLCLAVN